MFGDAIHGISSANCSPDALKSNPETRPSEATKMISELISAHMRGADPERGTTRAIRKAASGSDRTTVRRFTGDLPRSPSRLLRRHRRAAPRPHNCEYFRTEGVAAD